YSPPRDNRACTTQLENVMHGEHSRSSARTLDFREFVVLTALVMACQAIAVDTMLPALPAIGHDLGVTDANSTQWVITTYIAGVGLGQLFWGMLSDRFGRRRVLLIGLTLYVLAAAAVGMAGTFEALLVWRFVHGIAAASMVIARSIIRDLYGGRQMARVMSLTFIVFLMVPVLAPSLGQLILFLAPWRTVFILFGAYALCVLLWVSLRLPETQHPEYRLTLTLDHILSATALVLGNRISLCYTLALAVMFGSILAYVGMVPQIFEHTFQHPGLMPTMFALCAASMGVTAFLNSRIVERVGMRYVSHLGLLVFIGFTAVHALIAAAGWENLPTFVVLQAATMACLGLTASNFGAMAMEPVGAVAGVGASLQGFISTFGGAVVGALIGRGFDGTTLPLVRGAFICGLAALVFVLLAEQWRLFRAHHAGSAPPIEGVV
ncbi:MAG: multidrug effflux MFS transporter, partial [Steroidobacteraceae bacterium]